MVAKGTFTLHRKTSLGASQSHNKAPLSVPMWLLLCFHIMLLRWQSLDNIHCQQDHLGKQRRAWTSTAPNLNYSICSKHCAPAEVWAGCRQRDFPEYMTNFPPAMVQGLSFHSNCRAVWGACVFFCVCACVNMARFCSESYHLFDFVLKVTKYIRILWGFCWICGEKQSLLLSCLHWHFHTFWRAVRFSPSYVVLSTPPSSKKSQF